MDHGNSLQEKLHKRVVNLLTGELATHSMTAEGLRQISSQRVPSCQYFMMSWESLVAEADRHVKEAVTCICKAPV